MANNIIPNVTELDFDQIKQNLIDYFTRTDGPFKDWDFAGSGLQHILDVLAYNTHYNSMLAHLAANESFLGSAQLRKNVVARAKTLGYLPSSNAAARSTISLTGTDINTLTSVPKGTSFSSNVGGNSYSFITLSDVQGTFAPDDSQRKSLEVYQGSLKTVEYVFDASQDNQKFVIPDEDVDISTLSVSSVPNVNSSEVTSYSQFSLLSNLEPTSTVYFISENPNGLYEIEFGDDVIGLKPQSGAVVTIEYLVTDGDPANGAVTFTLDSDLGGSIEVDTATTSSGGGPRETIEEIRFNAPLSFTSQDRAVTADDYKAIIKNQLESVDAVSVWGGEDNDPIDLGAVYISAKKPGDFNNTLSDVEKGDIKEVLENKGVLTLRHVFVDPEFIYLYFDLFSKFNSNLTSLTTDGMESSILSTITKFDTANLEDYNSVFRYSQFLQAIDNSSPAILSTSARVYAYKAFDFTTTTRNQLVNFTFSLDEDEEDVVSTKASSTSSTFQIGGEDHFFGTTFKGNQEHWVTIWKKDGDNRSYYPNYTSTPDTYYGLVNHSTGVVLLGDVSDASFGDLAIVDSQYQTQQLPTITSNVSDMELHTRPSSNDVVARQNNIVKIDENESSITAEVDLISLGGNASVKGYTTHNRD
jgi:hypothetical protein